MPYPARSAVTAGEGSMGVWTVGVPLDHYRQGTRGFASSSPMKRLRWRPAIGRAAPACVKNIGRGSKNPCARGGYSWGETGRRNVSLQLTVELRRLPPARDDWPRPQLSFRVDEARDMAI